MNRCMVQRIARGITSIRYPNILVGRRLLQSLSGKPYNVTPTEKHTRQQRESMRRENEAGTQGDLSNNGGDYAGKNEEASGYEKS